MTKNIFGLFLLISIVGFSQKCTYTLKGTVTDFHNGLPLKNATALVKNSKKYAVTNSKGEFTIAGLCKGEITLVISHVSCKTLEKTIEIKGNLTSTFLLEHHLEELDEVSITAATKKVTTTAQETVIKAATLERYTNLSLGDVLKEVPGVSSINTGNGIVKPMINGLHSSRVLIINNGVRLQDQEWGIEHAPSVDINSANQISVIKGSAALAYGGDAIGGVVVMKPSRIILKDTLYGKTISSFQTNGLGAHITSSLHKSFASGWFANIQASFKKNGDFRAPDYNLTNTGLNSTGISVQFGKKKFESGFEVYYSYLDNEIGILGASHIGSIFDLARAINTGQPNLIDDFSFDIASPRQEIKHHLAKASYYKRFQNFGKLSLQYDYQNNQRLEFDVRIGDLRNLAAVDLTLQTHSFLADVNLDTNLNRKINFGFMARYQENFPDPSTRVRRLIPDYDKYDFGAYTTTEWKLNDQIQLDAGIRYDFSRIDAFKFYLDSRWEERGYDTDFSDIIIDEDVVGGQLSTNPQFDYHNLSASVGLKYILNDNNQLILNYSLASRPPNPSELFSDGLHHSAARFEIGDIRFNSEIANRVGMSYAYNTPKFNLYVDAYYNTINNFIYLRPVTAITTIRGPFPVWEYRQTDAQIFGIDASATLSLADNWQWQSSASFIKGYDTKTDLPLIDMPPFSTTNQISYNHPSWYNFSVSIISDWVFEQNEFPDFNFDVEIPFTTDRITVDISTPPPAYHLLHLYSEATFSISKKVNLTASVSINNILDTRYRNYLNRLRFFADDLGRNVVFQLQLNY